VRLRCPICGEEIDSAGLRMEWGPGGGFRCPSCKGPVRVSQPYRTFSAILSFLIASGILILIGVRFSGTFLLLTAIIWIPVSLFLNMVASRFKRPTLSLDRSGLHRPAYELFAKGDHAESSTSPQNTPQQERRESNSEEDSLEK